MVVPHLICGWLFDLYHDNAGNMTAWLIDESGNTHRLTEKWVPQIYIKPKDASAKSLLSKVILNQFPDAQICPVEKFVYPRDFDRSIVFEIRFGTIREVLSFTRWVSLNHPLDFELFNVGVPPAQTYLYGRDLFPTAFVRAQVTNESLDWELRDDSARVDYELPHFRVAKIAVTVRGPSKLHRITDTVASIEIETLQEKIVYDQGSEADKILQFVNTIGKLDPDIILTEDGDAFIFPLLMSRSAANGIGDELLLGRERRPLSRPRDSGKVYFSYGRIFYKPTPARLYGRLHLDTKTDFLFDDCSDQGLFEVARTCRTPLHRASRETIGTNMTSLQMYIATRNDILIPWKKNDPENFKCAKDLLIADRGGLIFEPRVGAFEDVGELDFASLYPALMMKENLTPECLSCHCCQHPPTTVPELGYRICERRVGIIPRTLQILLQKRADYKQAINSTHDRARRELYEKRQAALKWILVCCLSYDTVVPILADGRLQTVEIGRFIDDVVEGKEGIFECNADIRVVGLGEDFRSKYSRVRRFIKTRAPKRMFEILMEDGRRICATPNHEFYALNRGRLDVRRADQLKESDLIPVGKILPDPPKIIKKIDIIETLRRALDSSEIDGWRVKGRSLRPAIWHKRKLFYRMGLPYANVHSWIRSGIIPLRYFEVLSIPSATHHRLLIGRGRVKGGRITWIPSVIPVDRNLGFFLGLFVADGSAGRSFLRFDIGQDEPELLTYLRAVSLKLFRLTPHVSKDKRARMYVAQINSVALMRVLETALGIAGAADRGKLRVPDCIMNGRSDAIVGFISGLVAGDGSVHKTRNMVMIATASESFQKNLSYLLLRAGFPHSLRRSHRKPAELYRVDIVGTSSFVRLKRVGFLKKRHERRLSVIAKETCTKECHHAFYELIPVVNSNMRRLARKLRTVRDPRIDIADRVCPTRGFRMLRRLRVRSAHQLYPAAYGFLEKIASGDAGFARIREIREIHPPSDFVYCFELKDPLPGFFAGNGAIFTHNSFGYLGYKNARFGKIDAHIAVCAHSRGILRRATEMAEAAGFRVIHGIVDSLWLQKPGMSDGEFYDLSQLIERDLKLPISYEGRYKWIVFLPSRMHSRVPVLNRYYGVLRDGKIKARGIELRRRDTPNLIKRFQRELIQALSSCSRIDELQSSIPDSLRILERFIQGILDHDVPLEDLAFHRQLSKDSHEYLQNSVQTIAVKKLRAHGAPVSAGQVISFVITDEKARNPSNRSEPLELADRVLYDEKKYVSLLLDSAVNLLLPLGWTRVRIRNALNPSPADLLSS
jgi:DNA polymerase elongation subunit (family B)